MYPKINQTIIINTPNDTYKTVVAEVTDTEILIGYPLVAGKSVMLPADTKLTAYFVTGDNQYKFETEIMGRKKDNIALYRLKKPVEKEVARIQRRENFRVPAILQISVEDQNFSTVNISGGGILFSCPFAFEAQLKDEVSCSLKLPTAKETDLLSFKARVVRISLQEDDSKKFVGLEFSGIDERSRTKIIQYCFEKQRQNR